MSFDKIDNFNKNCTQYNFRILVLRRRTCNKIMLNKGLCHVNRYGLFSGDTEWDDTFYESSYKDSYKFLLSKTYGISIYREICFSIFAINAASLLLFWIFERGSAWLQKYWLMIKIVEILFCSSSENPKFVLWQIGQFVKRTNYLSNDELYVNLWKDRLFVKRQIICQTTHYLSNDKFLGPDKFYIFMKADFITPSEQLFKELNWLPFPKQVQYHGI